MTSPASSSSSSSSAASSSSAISNLPSIRPAPAPRCSACSLGTGHLYAHITSQGNSQSKHFVHLECFLKAIKEASSSAFKCPTCLKDAGIYYEKESSKENGDVTETVYTLCWKGSSQAKVQFRKYVTNPDA